MKSIIVFILSLFLIGTASSQSFNKIPGKQDFTDSIKFSKFLNSVGEDSVLTIDRVTKKLKFVLKGGGSGSYVPYTGATSSPNLGEFGISEGFSQYDTTATTYTRNTGNIGWNDTDGTLEFNLKGNSVSLQIGQETVLRVVNKTGSNLLESQYLAVYVSGAQGQRVKVNLASANADSMSAKTIGVVTENIAVNQEGFITTSGLVREINTTGSLQGETWADGDILYLSPTINGGLTNIKPTAPQHTVLMGYCVYAHAIHGSIFVKVVDGFKLDDLHNVKITTPLNNEALIYETSTKLWKNKITPTDTSLIRQIVSDSIANRLTNITGLVTAGTNVTLTGSGTTISPYVVSSSGTSVTTSEQVLTSTASQTAFTFTSVPASYSDYIIFVNGGAAISTTHYTTSGNVVTMTTPLDLNDKVILRRTK